MSLIKPQSIIWSNVKKLHLIYVFEKNLKIIDIVSQTIIQTQMKTVM